MQIPDAPRIDAQMRTAHGLSWFAAQTRDHPSRLLHWPWRENPYPAYARLRAQGPVTASRLGFRMANTYESVSQVLRGRDFLVTPPEGVSRPDQFDVLDLPLPATGCPPTTRGSGGRPGPRSVGAGCRGTRPRSRRSPTNRWTRRWRGATSTSCATSRSRCRSR